MIIMRSTVNFWRNPSMEGIFTLIVALSISGVAAYYSIFGLAKIFSAAVIPVIIMGTVLEVGKLVTASWLYRNWDTCPKLMRAYFVSAVLALMFITSMGIFGFLSSAHIEQTLGNSENIAKIERIESEIGRIEFLIGKSNEKIESLENADIDFASEIQEQIQVEQDRIDTAYERIEPMIRVQMNIIDSENSNTENRISPYRTEIDNIDSRLSSLDEAIRSNNVRSIQSIVGTRVDGSYGEETAERVSVFRDQQLQTREELLNQIDVIRNAPNENIESAMDEIKNIRDIAREEIEGSNQLIKRLRSQLGAPVNEDKLDLISKERTIIDNYNTELDELTIQKFDLESSNRKLEAEVGPVKYIAEMVVGPNTNEETLEIAVRWIILLIVFVFDPLAVLLVIAANMNILQAQQRREMELASIPAEEYYEEPESTKETIDIEDVENILMKTQRGWRKIDRAEKRRRELNETLKKDEDV